MGGKKRSRNTAKTGDKSLYKSRDESTPKSNKDDDNDGMYNEVDQFHNAKEQVQDYLALDGGDSPDEEEDDGYNDKEAVLDLAGGSSSDDDDDDDDSEDEKDEKNAGAKVASSSDDDSDDDDEPVLQKVGNWGRKTSHYHGGDTADLEIGQDEEDAYLEEEAAQQVQKARYQHMDEQDFVLSEDDDDDAKASDSKSNKQQGKRDWTKLSKSQKRKLLQSHHPELLPLVTHFSEVVKDFTTQTKTVTEAVLSSSSGDNDDTIAAVDPKEIGATQEGLEYLLTKSLLQSSTALNVATYLLLKCEMAQKQKEEEELSNTVMFEEDIGAAIKQHPVMMRLQQLDDLTMKLQDNVETPELVDQMNHLVKAVALMKETGGGSDEDEAEDTSDEEDSADETKTAHDSVPAAAVAEEADSDNNNIDSDDGEEGKRVLARGVLNEARFGLRPQEVSAKVNMERRRLPLDYFEAPEEGDARKASRSLASTMNTIQQRTSSKSSKRKTGRPDEDLDQHDGPNDSMRKAVEMMEAELGPLDDEEDGEVGDDDMDNDDGVEDFYSRAEKTNKRRKAFKDSMYKVAPKYPGMEAEVNGERAISKVILKNRGLVAHKNKLNRNPRVKKREQFRKAIIKRKGKVRDVRTNEGHRYGGEETGIKSGISRSRKLGSR